jgi:DNA polymerase
MVDRSEAHTTAAALLAWYRDMGVDAAIGEDAIDWFAHPAAPGAGFALETGDTVPAPVARKPSTPPSRPVAERSAPAAVPVVPRAPVAAPPDESIADAVARAARAQSLADLREALATFDGCALKATAKSLCFARGADRARVMLIGEAPGSEEDLAGHPFAGRAGALLDRMFAAIGVDSASVHMTNTVYWRPPGNRTPTPHELAICRPFLERHVALVDPAIVIVVGGAATKHVLDATEAITRLRGKWRMHTLGGAPRQVLPTLHPSFLLLSPEAKRLAWRDLLTLAAALAGTPKE